MERNQPSPPGEFSPISVSVPGACSFTGLPRTAICEAIADGRLLTAKIGRRRVVLFESLREFVRGSAELGIAPEDSERGRAARGVRGAP